jgi:hypothetical protein
MDEEKCTLVVLRVCPYNPGYALRYRAHDAEVRRLDTDQRERYKP